MNVKQGDLAITVNTKLPENIGKVVSVVKFLGDIFGVKDVWLVDFNKPTNVDAGSGIILSNIAHVRDAWLRPISGIPDADHIDESIGHDAGIAVPA
jgi:hypothetical protein